MDRSALVAAHLDQVYADARQLLDAQTQLWASVAAAREERVTWAEIAGIVGTTRQAAQQRFAKPPAGRLRL